MASDIVIEGGERLHAVAAKLRAAGPQGKELRRGMRRAIQETAQPLVEDVKRRALAIPTSGTKSTGLRAAIARATKLEIRASGSADHVSITVRGSLMPPGKSTLPPAMDGTTRWRHPVYGNANNWVSQDSHPYFTPAVEHADPSITAAVIAVVDATALAIMES
ncbi:MAG TPA: hypothetical protein VFJ14_17930 [Nocardioidaceae bacterium]|nr:hypothetical protein [Nocardioidaceae bacterium]